MKIAQITKLSQAKEKALIENQEISKSQKIRELFHAGNDIKSIASKLSIRYNFAYNIISNYININSIDIIEEKKESKKDKIIELYLKKLSLKEISIEMKSNYNYVHKIIKEYKELSKEKID